MVSMSNRIHDFPARVKCQHPSVAQTEWQQTLTCHIRNSSGSPHLVSVTVHLSLASRARVRVIMAAVAARRSSASRAAHLALSAVDVGAGVGESEGADAGAGSGFDDGVGSCGDEAGEGGDEEDSLDHCGGCWLLVWSCLLVLRVLVDADEQNFIHPREYVVVFMVFRSP